MGVTKKFTSFLASDQAEPAMVLLALIMMENKAPDITQMGEIRNADRGFLTRLDVRFAHAANRPFGEDVTSGNCGQAWWRRSASRRCCQRLSLVRCRDRIWRSSAFVLAPALQKICRSPERRAPQEVQYRDCAGRSSEIVSRHRLPSCQC